MVDKKAFRSLSCGLYIVTARGAQGSVGCVVNTFQQVTSSPAQASIAINKDNVTTAAILESGMFEVSVLCEDAPMELIGRFGFHSSADTDKFADTQTARDAAGIAYVTERAAAHFCLKVAQTLDLGTHMLVVGEVVEAAVLSDGAPMTYAYYHQVKGGKTPPKASSYEGDGAAAAAPSSEAQEASAHDAAPRRFAWRCTVCGHIEYVDELPDDFRCPLCGVGKELFERIEL